MKIQLRVNTLSKVTELVITGVTIFMKCLLSGKHYYKNFTYINSSNPHYFIKQVFSYYPHFIDKKT